MITIAADQSLVDKDMGVDQGPVRLKPEESAELADAERQRQYWQAYRLQQARMACPGCGDDGTAF